MRPLPAPDWLRLNVSSMDRWNFAGLVLEDRSIKFLYWTDVPEGRGIAILPWQDADAFEQGSFWHQACKSWYELPVYTSGAGESVCIRVAMVEDLLDTPPGLIASFLCKRVGISANMIKKRAGNKNVNCSEILYLESELRRVHAAYGDECISDLGDFDVDYLVENWPGGVPLDLVALSQCLRNWWRGRKVSTLFPNNFNEESTPGAE